MASQKEIDELKSERASFFCEMATIFGTGKPRKGESHNEFWLRKIGENLSAEEKRYAGVMREYVALSEANAALQGKHATLIHANNILRGEHSATEETAANSHNAGHENRRRLRHIRIKLTRLGLLAERGTGISDHSDICEYSAPFCEPVPEGGFCDCHVGTFQKMADTIREMVVLALHEDDR